jgi:DNA modification methylase
VIIRADARALPLRDRCVQCVVTSPPYFGLRDYGIDNQIGLEPTPAVYIAVIVAVFAEVRRVLRDDGTVWLNLGDSYASAIKGSGGPSAKQDSNAGSRFGSHRIELGETKAKDLFGIPWRVAFALQADGWYLRSDIIWAKPNPMPESVTDRPTKAHEYLFLLTKSERYYYNADAIAEKVSAATIQRAKYHWCSPDTKAAAYQSMNGLNRNEPYPISEARNKRSVWTIPTMPYSGAHFATMPEKLIEPCILAGCPAGALVFDPFLGSGTVGAVAERLDRRWAGTDLNYQPLAATRTAQRGLMFAQKVQCE